MTTAVTSPAPGSRAPWLTRTRAAVVASTIRSTATTSGHQAAARAPVGGGSVSARWNSLRTPDRSR